MLCVTFTSSCGAGLASARGLCAAGETQGLCRSLAKRPRCGHGYWMDVCAGLILEGAVRLVCLYMWRWGLFALVPGRPAQGRGGADGAACARGEGSTGRFGGCQRRHASVWVRPCALRGSSWSLLSPWERLPGSRKQQHSSS